MACVDVIVPCYKYGHYLRDCVRSVLDQGGVEVRVLVLDDASPDNTPEVGEALAAEDRRVEYRRHAANQGHIATYNEGLAWMRGDYALLLSADDMLTPGALHRAARLMDEHPEVALTYGRAISTPHPGTDHWRPPQDYTWRVIAGQELIETMCQRGENIVPTPTAIVRARLQQSLGGYRQDLPHTADMEMWLRLAAHGAVGVFDVEQAYYRTHGSNMSISYLGFSGLQGQFAAFEVLFEQYGDRIRDVPRLRRLAAKAIAEEVFWVASNLFDRGELSACVECLNYALDLHPQLRWQPKWLRFRCKQLMGPRLWAAVSPYIHRMRGRAARTA